MHYESESAVDQYKQSESHRTKSGSAHLSPCCVSLCLRRSTFLWKPFPHRSQPKGLNPVCFLLCVMRLEL